ncbi:MAG: hypothetical protein IKG93_00025 [Clostridiales bacterium]|nr:hypothetical protein [Clostridiales bacterium]
MTMALMVGSFALSGCAKKAKAMIKPNKEIDSVLSDLKAKTEDSKYHLQGEVSSYDGKTMMYMSFHDEMKTFVSELCNMKYEITDDWNPTKITYPVYHFYLEAFDTTIEQATTEEQKNAQYTHWCAFWSNGYLVTSDGDAWKCKFDLDAVTKDVEPLLDFGPNTDTMLAYKRMSALWKDRWYKENMQTLDEYITRTFDGESMTVSKADGWNAVVTSRNYEEITVEVKNENVPELCSGEYFGPVFVKIDNEWYCVPSDVSNNPDGVYHDIGIIVPQGGTQTITNWRGYLPNGEYAVFVDCAKDTGVFEYVLAEFVV